MVIGVMLGILAIFLVGAIVIFSEPMNKNPGDPRWCDDCGNRAREGLDPQGRPVYWCAVCKGPCWPRSTP